MTGRVVHPRQQGARLSWSDTMFEQVERAKQPEDDFPNTVPMPLMVCEVDMAEFERAVAAQQRRAGP